MANDIAKILNTVYGTSYPSEDGVVRRTVPVAAKFGGDKDKRRRGKNDGSAG
jgi:hypothetical protein